MFSEGILIYFYTDRFGSVTYINTVNKGFLVWYLRHSIRRERLIEGRRLFQILLTGSHALNILFYYPI